MCQDVQVAHVVRPFRGVSAEERRSTRRASLLDACLTVAAIQGTAGTTVEAVCNEADLSKRYFYESFRNRDELFTALAEDLIAEITRAIISSLSSTTPGLLARTRVGIGRVITILTEDPRKARFYVDVVGADLLSDTVGGAEYTLSKLLVELVVTDADSTDEQREQLGLVALIIVTGSASAVTAWLDNKIVLTHDALIDGISHMAIAAARTVRSDI